MKRKLIPVDDRDAILEALKDSNIACFPDFVEAVKNLMDEYLFACMEISSLERNIRELKEDL